MTQSAGGDAHAWAAVNHHATILFLDPQTRQISEDIPLYRHAGDRSQSNVVQLSALVTDPNGNYASARGDGHVSAKKPADPTGEASPEGVGPADREAFDSLEENEQSAISDACVNAADTADAVWEDLGAVARQLRSKGAEFPDLVGTEFRVKSKYSLGRAFADLSPFQRHDVGDFIRDTKDLIRFSMRVPENGYGATVRDALVLLEARGYRVEDRLSFWGQGGRHNGLNVTLIEPTGRKVELQFPTPTSWQLGKETHKRYETLRSDLFSPAERVEAFLEILAINRAANIDLKQPTDLHLLGEMRVKDSSFQRWIDNNRADWQEFERSHDVSAVLARIGLDASEVFGPTRDPGGGG